METINFVFDKIQYLIVNNGKCKLLNISDITGYSSEEEYYQSFNQEKIYIKEISKYRDFIKQVKVSKNTSCLEVTAGEYALSRLCIFELQVTCEGFPILFK